MVEGISGLGPASMAGLLQPVAPPPMAEGADFASTLDDAVARVDEMQHVADAALQGVASGENVDLHGTMIALEKADIALRAMVSVRDKVIGAYEQVMNMAI
jgi:flagellar hook-basal body complex protein FliE